MIPAAENKAGLPFRRSTCQVVVSATITAGIEGNCSLKDLGTRSDTPAPYPKCIGIVCCGKSFFYVCIHRLYFACAFKASLTSVGISDSMMSGCGNLHQIFVPVASLSCVGATEIIHLYAVTMQQVHYLPVFVVDGWSYIGNHVFPWHTRNSDIFVFFPVSGEDRQ